MTDWDLKPRTVGELLDAAFFVYRRQFARLLLVAVIVSLPALAVAAVYSGDAAAAVRDWWAMLMDSSRRNHGGDFTTAISDSMKAVEKIQPFLMLSAFLQSTERAAGVVTMSFVAAAAVRRESCPPIGTLFRQAAPRLAAAILVQVVLDTVLGYCITCCLPIGFMLAVLFACTTVSIATDRGPLETSLRASVPAPVRWPLLPFAQAIDGIVRSARLSANGPALARGTLFLFFLMTFVGIAGAAAMAIGGIFAGTSGAWFWAQHCAEAICLPVWGLGIGLWYTDLRVRREGLDLAVAA